MIGEVVKLGFDGSAVTRGLKGVMGGFRGLKKGIKSATRQVGIGVGRQAGASAFGLILKGLTAIPNEINNLSSLNKELDVMNKTTGISAERYLALRSAMSVATNKGLEDARDDIKDFAEAIEEARVNFNSPQRQELNTLGIRMTDLKGKSIDEQIAEIGRKVQAYDAKFGAGKAIQPLRAGFGEQAANWLPLLLDFDNRMESAEKRTAQLAKQIKTVGSELENVGKIKEVLGRKGSQISLAVLEGLNKGGLKGGSIAGFIDSIDFSSIARGISKHVAQGLNGLKTAIDNNNLFGWIGDKLKQLGGFIVDGVVSGLRAATSKITEILKEIFKDVWNYVAPDFLKKKDTDSEAKSIPGKKAFNSVTSAVSGLLKPTKGVEAGSSEVLKVKKIPMQKMLPDGLDKLENNTSRTNTLLETLTDNTLTSRYA